METPTPSAICRAMSSIETAEAQQDETIVRAKRILKGLGFCGHYMHFHGGGRSGQIPILCMLDRCGGTLSQQELGMRFELKPGSLSEILSKMETAGLIERTRDTKDRRQLFVHLTDEGMRLAHLEHEKRDRFRRSAFTALTVEDSIAAGGRSPSRSSVCASSSSPARSPRSSPRWRPPA